MGLVSLQRAIQNSTLAALNSSNAAALTSIINAASTATQRYCHRDFTLTTYSEYYDGGIYPSSNPLRLRQFPITEITRIAGYPQPAILILNNDPATNQRATVETLTGGDVKLVRVASGVTTTSTQVAATNVTIGALATAINVLGGGWTATTQSNGINGDFSKFMQADFKPLQGAVTTFSPGAYLELYTEDIQPLNGGWGGYYGDWSGAWPGTASGWRLDPDTGEVFGRFPRGQKNIRVDYQAGFATVPDDVQEAVVQLCQFLYQQGQTNGAMNSVRLGDAAVVFNNRHIWPSVVTLALSPYRAYDKVIAR